MKSHKFFAWMTVLCFIMVMITGYKKTNRGEEISE